MRSLKVGMSVMILLPESSNFIKGFSGKSDFKNNEPRCGPQVWVITETLHFIERFAPIEWTHCSTPPTRGQ